MRVLVVDDSQIMRKIISGALRKLKINDIAEASNGQEAIDALTKDSSIGLVLMDWNMPMMTGIEAVKQLRADNIKTPIIMITTEGEKTKVIEAIKTGASDYLVKPFNPKDIQAKLEKFLQPATES